MSMLKVAAVQLNINWLDKQANLHHLDQILADEQLKTQNIDLILLPETFSTGFCIDNVQIEEAESGGLVLTWMKAQALYFNAVIAGSVLVTFGKKKVNRFYWVFPDGTVSFYDKRHLFRLGNEQDYVSQGQKREILEINGVKILPLVCYDLRFPVWSRNNQDYDLIVNVANWPSQRRYIWDTLLQARAIENQAYVIGVNRVGNDGNGTAHCGGTAVYDFVGKSINQAEDNQESVIVTELDFSKLSLFKQKFPMYLDADEFDLNT